MPAVLNSADDRAGYLVGCLPRRVAPGQFCSAFEQHVEMLGLGRPRGNDQHVDAKSCQLRPYGFVLLYALILSNGFSYFVVPPARFILSWLL